MEYKLNYGKNSITVEVNENNILDILMPNKVNIKMNGEEAVKNALLNPIGTKRLKDIVKQGEKVAIITSDITRPVPSKIILPEIIEELHLAGVKNEDIMIVFALGSHRKHSEEEKKYLVGDYIYNNIMCIDSDMNDCVNLGLTSSGTPVDIFRPVVEADRRICIGNIEYHYFAGYSGGMKAIMPGISSKRGIQSNHSKMILDGAVAGEMYNNPVRQDINEVASFIPVDFILNVVLDEHKNIIGAVAGHYIEAHNVGCKILDNLYKVKIQDKADIVIVSAGGFPKDLNLYQAQKALDNAKHAVRCGGIIILVAECNEGLGNKTFENWLMRANSPDEIIEMIQKNFELGGHKAAAIAKVAKNCSIYLVSKLDKKIAEKAFMKLYTNIQTAFDDAIKCLGNQSRVTIMPFGGSTLPVYYA